MSESFSIDIPKLPGFEAAMRGAPKVLDAELLVAARRIGKHGEALSKVYAPVGVASGGNLRNSIWSDGRRSGSGVEAIWGAHAEYAPVVDKGRGAGKPMPPKGALLPFMAAVGIPEEAEFAVRRKIGRDGIKARPFVSRAFNEIKRGFALGEFSQAITRTLRWIGGG